MEIPVYLPYGLTSPPYICPLRVHMSINGVFATRLYSLLFRSGEEPTSGACCYNGPSLPYSSHSAHLADFSFLLSEEFHSSLLGWFDGPFCGSGHP